MSRIKSISKNLDILVIPAIVVVAAILLFANYSGRKATDSTQPVRDRTWFQEQVVASAEPVVVKFGAEWCGPCRSLDGVIDQYQQQAGSVEVHKVDVDSSPELASDFSVRSIPHVILFKNGEAVANFTGSRSLDSFSEWVDSNR